MITKYLNRLICSWPPPKGHLNVPSAMSSNPMLPWLPAMVQFSHAQSAQSNPLKPLTTSLTSSEIAGKPEVARLPEVQRKPEVISPPPTTSKISSLSKFGIHALLQGFLTYSLTRFLIDFKNLVHILFSLLIKPNFLNLRTKFRLYK